VYEILTSTKGNFISHNLCNSDANSIDIRYLFSNLSISPFHSYCLSSRE